MTSAGEIRARGWVTLGATLLAISAAVVCLRYAMRSPMFLLQVVEVADQPDTAPVDAAQIAKLANLPVGKINLFELSLEPIEERLLTHPWIREVRLQKLFPQTLSISVTFREPQAILQGENGALSYVDVDGKVFGKVDLQHSADLPIIAASGAAHVQEALSLISAWTTSELAPAAQISTLLWDSERGFRVLATYPLEGVGAHGRTLVDIGHWANVGQEIDGETQFKRLTMVFQYLTAHRVQARQIWADAGKKIVVRTSHGS